MVFCVDVRVLCQEQNGCAVRVDPGDLICQLYHSTIPLYHLSHHNQGFQSREHSVGRSKCVEAEG